MPGIKHLHDELAESPARVTAETRYGPVVGGRAANGAAVWLEVPFALPPGRFEDPKPLPVSYRYEGKEYIREDSYCAQPTNDGQSASTPFEDKVGFGKPTENPLFANIVAPPSFPDKQKRLPVKVYIHGGFLQFGSPHHLNSQAQYISAARNEVWVNIGYRLSIFGFLASDKPSITGNYGFKDQWLGLEWIKDNIVDFGGNPNDITLSGLSAGAHSVHQLLHHASRLPAGQLAPFHSVILQSNSIIANPKTPKELRAQYEAVCKALSLDLASPTAFDDLRDPCKIPADRLTKIIESEQLGVYGTFRGTLEPGWFLYPDGSTKVDVMEWQRSGGLAKGLLEHGVKSVVVGELTEEWYLYSIAHPVEKVGDIEFNLDRYYEKKDVEKMLSCYRHLPDDASHDDIQRLFGEILSDGQVYIPVRLLARDLLQHGYPALRYIIQWTPEQMRPLGYVTHGSDRVMWALRIPSLEYDQAVTAGAWLDRIDKEIKEIEGKSAGALADGDLKTVLALREDKTIGWIEDKRWDELMKIASVLEGA
ncbi:carboxylesterase [Gloeophyllum trabeum ATCC 11539]|uniref:Carboxylic ester hydrolase n=1 Tax=Gloeophyllum trabeum (strain ATCC 11539 / FP-39264 / Madison 617) TaxID=670483 RepID=S7RLC1_GLOTA|nr:carboxylesterase [Gloeophyllum trabeum ATCC 11539]EPQ55190.1 carboxylesterase [Gloeophyllum trabeum ATCC 11539]